jgi:hypothetical protein
MDRRALEQAIARLPEVEHARVVVNGNTVTEVHVLASSGKPAKQLVRDVQSVALAGFDVEVDRRVISVVQFESPDLANRDRPLVEDVSEQIDGSRMKVTVTLSWRDAKLVGVATGPAASSTRLQLVAEATVAAIEQALDEAAALGVTAVATPRVGSENVAIAQIVVVIGGRERMVIGSALAGDDPSKAMVRAVLDALNRQVPTLRRT